MFSSKKLIFNSKYNLKKTWRNIDQKIYGQSGERFGRSVSISSDGKSFAVGKNQQSFSVARVYQLNQNNILEQKGSDIEVDGSYGESEVSISSDGNLVVLGFASHNNSAGCLKVYEWNGNDWLQKGSNINEEATGNLFGQSVSISSDGTTILAGAPGLDNGYVKIYEWIQNEWNQKGSAIYGKELGDKAGFSVDISSDGNVIIFGAPKAGISGCAYVYEWSILESDWIQKGQDIEGEKWNIGDDSGHSVSISSNGNILAIGAPLNDAKDYLNDPGLANSGHVRIYEWKENSWIQRGEDIDGEASGDYSGWAVDLSDNGNIVAIGAIYNDGSNQISSGHVRVYEWDEFSWNKKGEDIDGESEVIWSGYSLSISSDGTKVAIGSLVDHLPERIDSKGSVKLLSFE